MRQRSCRVNKDLSGETFENQCIDDYLPTTEAAPIIDDQINIKVGMIYLLLHTNRSLKSSEELELLVLPVLSIKFQ